MSPEIEVLTLCARQKLDAPERDALQRLFRGPMNWAKLLQQADEHGLISILHSHLYESETSPIPQEFLAQLREKSRDAMMQALFLSAELFRVLEELQRAEIPAIPHKGPVLSTRAFGNPALRQFEDLDIVVPQRFIPRVCERMLKIGYESRLPLTKFAAQATADIPGEYVFVQPASHTIVEFHTERTLRYFPRTPNIDAMIRRATTVKMSGKEVPAFSAEDEMLLLAVHGAKDLWARLIWIADIAELVSSAPAMEWNDAIGRANEMQIGRMLRLALLLAHEIVGMPYPPECETEIRADRMASRLAKEVYCRILTNAPTSYGVMRRSVYRIGMVEGLWNGMRHWMRLSTAPAEEDWATLNVPSRMSSFYGILRPVRLWKKYGPGSVHTQ